MFSLSIRAVFDSLLQCRLVLVLDTEYGAEKIKESNQLRALLGSRTMLNISPVINYHVGFVEVQQEQYLVL